MILLTESKLSKAETKYNLEINSSEIDWDKASNLLIEVEALKEGHKTLVKQQKTLFPGNRV
jgi:hypothetical protein